MSTETQTDSNLNSNFVRQTGVKRFVRRLVQLAVGMTCVAIWLWCIGFSYCLDDYFPNWMAYGIALAIAVVTPILFFRFRKTQPLVGLIALMVIAGFSWLGFCLLQPTHDRDWGIAQKTLPFAELSESTESNIVVVHNIRANRYGPVAPDTDSHYDDTYDLSKLKTVWFGVDRFTDVEPLAHTFLSFGFESGSHRSKYLAFSVETRREKDEAMYSPIRGLFRNYEIIYVISDEQDALSGRSDIRENVIQLYPVRASEEQVRAMFLDMLGRANSIRDQPEFYHTLTSNCTNNIVYHTNKVLDKPISPWARGVVFPGYSDWLAFRLGMIDTELTLEEARERFRIDQRIKHFDGKSDFSDFIRAQ